MVHGGRTFHYYTGWSLGVSVPLYRFAEVAVSTDGGATFVRAVCIDYATPSEHALSRPCVVRDGDRYRRWYAYRGATYRIGYAESHDGTRWIRKDDEAGIDVSPSGNGNGRTGIGLGVLA